MSDPGATVTTPSKEILESGPSRDVIFLVGDKTSVETKFTWRWARIKYERYTLAASIADKGLDVDGFTHFAFPARTQLSSPH